MIPQILLHDGTYKQVSLIKRGDIVAADSAITCTYTVARVNIANGYNADIFQVLPDTFGQNVPHTSLYITANHPIIS